MDYKELDQVEYDRKLRMVIVGSEGLHAGATLSIEIIMLRSGGGVASS
jgi:hypothetical protein